MIEDVASIAAAKERTMIAFLCNIDLKCGFAYFLPRSVCQQGYTERALAEGHSFATVVHADANSITSAALKQATRKSAAAGKWRSALFAAAKKLFFFRVWAHEAAESRLQSLSGELTEVGYPSSISTLQS